MSKTPESTTPWAQQQRLKFVERQLLWGRMLNARMLMDAYGISRHQANKDIKLYTDLFPSNVNPYSAAEKCHRPSPCFTPELISQDPIEVVRKGGFSAIEGASVIALPTINRRVVDGVIPAILAAIDTQSDIETIYASSTTPVGKRRRLHPTVLIYAANRLHIRAYCYERKGYRDFVLSRMLATPKLLTTEESLGPDEEFEATESINLVVNPELPKMGQDLINREYQLGQHSTFVVRKCLVNYFLQANSLPASKKQVEEAKQFPWAFPVVTDYSDFW